jgi:hypothetical protein
MVCHRHPQPGKPWGVHGMARPLQYLAPAVLLGGFTLVVDNEGTAMVSVPAGCKVTVLTSAA